ncbi:winged helix DNA-binding domain-containing protein [Mycolicibacterium arenosum]|uniref:Winged helix DNA-binding domain-containing protein n=1 Tax=Mycolicibacterium arenosum TaxID=2952157 RepID=A0ABT1M199_9MYCO|nr:winged helix DNA-binding domain-containing protein [Mycolicibacterium sp. CAU 1645]MCP9272572.1 winged helix DNA-binding domain-containing protein [Mycolicibacterium sp. CAU 1645]
MRSFTLAERRARLGRRHLLTAPGDEPIAATARRFVGLHATDPATPYLTLWARRDDFAVADLDDALYTSRSVVKHLAMRRTLWAVAAGDLPAVQVASSDRVSMTEHRKLIADVAKAGIAADGDLWLERAASAVLRHLGETGHASARELRLALPELAGEWDAAPGKPWGGTSPISPRVLTVMSARGDLMRGPNDGSWTTSRPRWVATADWLASDRDGADHGEASADLVTAWLRTFGPATVNDVKWWFGHTLTWTREALRAAGAVEVDLHGTPGVALADDLDGEADAEPWCALLPGLDVTTMGWQERDWYLGDHRAMVFDNRGNAGPTAWVDGRVVGAWVQDADAKVSLRLLEDVGRSASKALQRKADQLTDWLDGVRIAPRFPSPLSKAG